MIQKIQNNIAITVRNTDLREYTDLKCFIKQGDIEYQFPASVSPTDPSVMFINIPKATALNFSKGSAKIQVAVTDKFGMPHTHTPVKVTIGELLWEEGYGN